MRYSLVLSPYVIDEKEGTLEIDYRLAGFTESEKLAVFINGEERCKRLYEMMPARFGKP